MSKQSKGRVALPQEHSRGFIIPAVQASNSNELSIELKDAPPPSRSFCADGCVLAEKHGQVLLQFTQRRLDESVRALLEIRMSRLAFLQWARKIPELPNDFNLSSEFFPEQFTEPDQTIAQQAVLIRMMGNSHETIIDFFSVALDRIASGEKLLKVPAEGVVRVTLPGLFADSFFYKCKQIGSDIKNLGGNND